MTTSTETAAPARAQPFKTLAALRAAHTELLKGYHTVEDQSQLPGPLRAEVETFLQRGSATGALLDLEEDRADAQVLLNYWTTVTYDAGLSRRPALLAEFDRAAAAASVGAGSPYRGLRPFSEQDAPLFFGRRRLARRMVEVIGQGRLLAVVGLSGSGKSSVVRAGLMPDLQQGAVPGSESWHYFPTFAPGGDPLTNLARATRPENLQEEEWRGQLASSPNALDAWKGEQTLVLVVDQLEELFTIAPSEEDRSRFLEHLVRLATQPGTPHRVIVTLRSDFEPQLARYPALQALFTDAATVRVPPLDPVGLRTAIEMPAARQGLTFETGLIEELVHQVVGEPAGLPLLQFALQKLWERREGHQITWSSYRDLGGNVREILARSADATYQSFALEEDRNVVEAIFARLVEPAPAGEVTNHRVPRASLSTIDAAPERIDRVLDKLLGDGLLRLTPGSTPAEDHVEVTHEALIRNWPRLVDWIAETRHRRRNRLQLAAAAETWAAHGRDPSGLLTGALLAEAQEFRDRTPLEQELVTASARAVKDVQRRQWQWLAGMLGVLAALLAWALLSTVGLRSERGDREQLERDTAEARQRYGKVVDELRLAGALKANLARELAEQSEAVRRLETQNNEAQANYLTVSKDLEGQSELARKAKEDFERIERETRDARARFDATAAKLEAASAELVKTQQQLENARAIAAKAEADATKAVEERRRAEEAKQRAEATVRQTTAQLRQNALATDELFSARPAIVVKKDRLDDVPDEWKILKEHRTKILTAASSVGAVQSERGTFATGFVVADDLVLTFTDAGLRPRFIDFSNQPGSKSELRFQMLELIDGQPLVVGAPNGAAFFLWRVNPVSTMGKPLPRPLVLARQPAVGPRLMELVIGYPMAMGSTNKGFSASTLDLLLGNDLGVKRVMPGYLLSVDEPQKVFFHDSFTVGGTAGAPVLDLVTGKVIGFHFAGGPATAESPGVKLALALWLFAEDPAFNKAGVRFEN